MELEGSTQTQTNLLTSLKIHKSKDFIRTKFIGTPLMGVHMQKRQSKISALILSISSTL